jgi:hypothetical protein
MAGANPQCNAPVSTASMRSSSRAALCPGEVLGRCSPWSTATPLILALWHPGSYPRCSGAPVALRYDSGDYGAILALALKAANYQGFEADAARR